MDILNTVSLESNSQIRINFDGGDLSSDAGNLSDYQRILSAYFEDDCADELTNEPVMTAILDKDAFIVTTMEMDPYQVIQFYCGRGKMENFIKEGKSGFDFASVSSSSRLVNANRFLVHALAYNVFNWFRRLALAVSMRKQRIDTIRLKLLKIAARMVKSARYKYFKLCSSCPYKKEFYETLENIRNLQPQLE